MASEKARKYKELREARGWSEGELARKLDVDESLVRDWESGDAEPDDAALLHLSHHYGMSQDSLRHLGDEAHHPDR